MTDLPYMWRGGKFVRMPVPKPLQAIIGKDRLIRGIWHSDPAEHARRYRLAVGEFQELLDEAARSLEAARWADHAYLLDRTPPLDVCFRRASDGEDGFNFEIDDRRTSFDNGMVRRGKPPREAIEIMPAKPGTPGRYVMPFDLRLSHRPVIKPAEVRPVIRFAELVDDHADRAGKSDRSRSDRQSFLARVAKVIGHDDAGKVTHADLEKYVDRRIADMKAGKIVATTIRSEVIELNGLFAFMAERHKIENPAKLRFRAGDSDSEERQHAMYSEEERRVLLLAARESTIPIIRWGVWMAAFSGMSMQDIADLDTRDIFIGPCMTDMGEAVESGQVVIYIREKYRRLKTGAARKRRITVHSSVLAEEFVEFVLSVKATGDGPLFYDLAAYHGNRNKAGANIVGKWMRQVVAKMPGMAGLADETKSFHAWRTTTRTQLERVCSPVRAAWIIGHGDSKANVDSVNYLKHPIPDVAAAIEGIPNPLSE